jgi:hypothetical protein
LGYEGEDGDRRPGQDARSFPWQVRHRFDPLVEALRQVPAAMKEIEKTLGKSPCTIRASHRISKRHLLEREDHAVTGTLLHAQRRRCDGLERTFLEQSLEVAAAE